MLAACAPGHTVRETDHHYCVRFGQLTYPSLPKGKHGKGPKQIEIGHIKQMVRQFGIEACAAEHIPRIGKPKG